MEQKILIHYGNQKYFIFVLVFVLYSCIVKLTLEQEPYNGNKIRIDGYYYHTYIGDKKLMANVYFLYNNGVIINLGGYIVNEGEQRFRKDIINGSLISFAKRYKSHYGLFQIN